MEYPRITVDELKAMMDKGEPVLILDVRRQEAYASSHKKIKGSVYLDPDKGIRKEIGQKQRHCYLLHLKRRACQRPCGRHFD